jgi:hypothetical protein
MGRRVVFMTSDSLKEKDGRPLGGEAGRQLQ